MSPVLPPRRPIILKASRDTLVLLVAASALTVAIGYSVHSRPSPAGPKGSPTEQSAAGEWAGQLADLAPPQPVSVAPAEPLSSDALTVPKEAMALPAPPRTPVIAVKPRLCDGLPCPPAVKSAAIIAAPAVPGPARRLDPPVRRVREASLMEKLDPLSHLSEVMKRPFATAGDTIVGWVKRF